MKEYSIANLWGLLIQYHDYLVEKGGITAGVSILKIQPFLQFLEEKAKTTADNNSI